MTNIFSLVNKAIDWAFVKERDSSGKASLVTCPTQDGRLALVSISRRILVDKAVCFDCVCRVDGEIEKSEGICYHILTACAKSAAEMGGKIYFMGETKAREMVCRPGNQSSYLVKINGNSGNIWGVYFPKKQEQPKQFPKKPETIKKPVNYCPNCAGVVIAEGDVMKCSGAPDMPEQGCGWWSKL